LSRESRAAEVVHLGAVGLVVVDHDQQVIEAEADRGLQFARAHQRAAVAEGRDREAVGRRWRRERGGQAKPDGLKRLGEDEAVLVGDRGT